MYIYCITNLINEKKYVGLSYNEPEKSKNYYGSGVYIKNSIKKYGKKNFKKEILETIINDDRELLNEREKFWIKKYDTIFPKGYNLTDGGDNNYILSEESRKKIGEKHKNKTISPEMRKKISDACKGKPSAFKGKHHTEEAKKIIKEKRKLQIISDETRRKMSISQKNMSLERKQKMSKSSVRKKKVLQIDKKTNEIINTFNTIKEASEKCNINRAEISKCLIGYRKNTGDYVWEYANKNDAHKFKGSGKYTMTENKVNALKKLQKSIYQIDIQTNEIINKFESIKEAAILTNCCRTKISACCIGKRKSSGGYKWKYAD